MKKVVNSLILFSILTIANINAQVTIGLDEVPVKGALLQLKQEKVVGGGANSKKGFMIPRVLLTDKNNLFPMFKGDEADYNDLKIKHTGLMVYNMNDGCSGEQLFRQGMYVWDGLGWNVIQGKSKSRHPNESETATTLTDRDGNVYHIAGFRTAGIWMTENLRTVTTSQGKPLTKGVTSSYTEMYYEYPNYRSWEDPPPSWTAIEGFLYNWPAATDQKSCSKKDQGQSTNTDKAGPEEIDNKELYGPVQGICPTGWHIPSDREWNALEREINNNPSYYAAGYGVPPYSWTETYPTGEASRGGHGVLIASGTPLPGTSYTGFSRPSDQGGFDVRFSGLIRNGSSGNYKGYTYFWTSSSFNNNQAYARLLKASDTYVRRYADNKDGFFSVRCKKDD